LTGTPDIADSAFAPGIAGVFALIEGNSVRNSRIRGGTAVSALCSNWSRGYFGYLGMVIEVVVLRLLRLDKIRIWLFKIEIIRSRFKIRVKRSRF